MMAEALFWIVLCTAIFVSARYWKKIRSYRDGMKKHVKASLAIALIYVLGFLLAGMCMDPLGALITMASMFCKCLIGFTVARRIPGFEPLPVTGSVTRNEEPLKKVAVLVLLALVATVAKPLIGGVGSSVGRFFGESYESSQVAGEFPQNKVTVFFMLLSGAGIAEETTYRLVLLSLIWVTTRRRWISIIGAAILFGAYHLTPLDALYLTFWKFPVTQFMGSFFTGLMWGYLYTRRGLETAIIGHTLSNWIPFALFY
jgi:hypothetical protein